MNQISNTPSLKQLAVFFWHLEDKYNLNAWEVNGVKLWQYSRFRIFNALAQATHVLEQAHSKKVGFFDLLKAFPSLLIGSLFHNPLIGKVQVDTLIFNSGRKQKIDNRYQDIYLDFFIARGDFGKYMLVDELFNNQHLIAGSRRVKYQDYQMVRYTIARYFIKIKGWHTHQPLIQNIEQDIQAEYDLALGLNKLLQHTYKMFVSDYQYFDKLLKKRKPKKVVMVCSYGYKKALIAAAKHQNIPTVEYQHGTITRYHMGYSYPNATSVDYFPDAMVLFGEYWQQKIKYPLSIDKLQVVGFPYFHRQAEKVQKTFDADTILILSQGAIGKALSELVLKDQASLAKYKVLYKLHPGEYLDWREKNQALAALDRLPNVTVIDHGNTDLYDYFAASHLVVGVYSTAVFEALALGCQVALLNLPGVEYFEDLTDSGTVMKFQDMATLIQHAENNKLPKVEGDLFFGRNKQFAEK